MATITESMKNFSYKRELQRHQAMMDGMFAHVGEISTGFTTAMEQDSFSGCAPCKFCQHVAGPSGTQHHVQSQRLSAFQSRSVASLRDTESASTWAERLRGGAGSDGAAGGADGRAAGGTGRAAGGADGGVSRGSGTAGDPPPPPDRPPSDREGAGRRCLS
jgi:hypothetical protein